MLVLQKVMNSMRNIDPTNTKCTPKKKKRNNDEFYAVDNEGNEFSPYVVLFMFMQRLCLEDNVILKLQPEKVLPFLQQK